MIFHFTTKICILRLVYEILSSLQTLLYLILMGVYDLSMPFIILESFYTSMAALASMAKVFTLSMSGL